MKLITRKEFLEGLHTTEVKRAITEINVRLSELTIDDVELESFDKVSFLLDACPSIIEEKLIAEALVAVGYKNVDVEANCVSFYI